MECKIKKDLEKAEQQIYGWNHARQGYSLFDLILGMGLTIEEWDQLRENGMVDYLPFIIQDQITQMLISQ